MRIEAGQLVKLSEPQRQTISSEESKLSMFGPKGSVRQFAQVYQQKWESVDNSSLAQIDKLSPANAQMLKLQRQISNISLETELMSKVADGFTSSIRTIQQSQG